MGTCPLLVEADVGVLEAKSQFDPIRTVSP
jgi:hypothetical protein